MITHDMTYHLTVINAPYHMHFSFFFFYASLSNRNNSLDSSPNPSQGPHQPQAEPQGLGWIGLPWRERGEGKAGTLHPYAHPAIDGGALGPSQLPFTFVY